MKKHILVFMLVSSLVLISLGFVLASHSTDPSSFTVNQSDSLTGTYLFNITISNTNGAGVNITRINITLPSGFTLLSDSNGSSIGNSALYNFTNWTSNILTWSNTTIYLINTSTTNYFWFRANATATPGTYYINITSVNISGANVGYYNTTIPVVVLLAAPYNVSFINANSTSATIPGLNATEFTVNVSALDNSNVTRFSFSLWNATASPAVLLNTTNLTSSGTNGIRSMNYSSLVEGIYLINVTVNDSLNNKNYSVTRTMYIDRTEPKVNLDVNSNNKNTTATSWFFAATSITDNLGLANATIYLWDASGNLVSSSTGDITSTSNTTGATLNLPSVGVYYWNVKATDMANNQVINSTNFTITRSSTTATAPSSGGGGSASSSWITVYYPNSAQLSAGFTQAFQVNYRMQATIINQTHFVGVKSLTTSSAMIEVSSTPQQATMSIGEVKKFDINGDNYYDIQVKLNSITSNSASLTTTSINELVSSGTTGENSNSEGSNESASGSEPLNLGTSSNVWVWMVLVIIIIVIAVILLIYLLKKNKSSKWEKKFRTK